MVLIVINCSIASTCTKHGPVSQNTFHSSSPQVKLWYDKVGHQLIVTILGAKDLPPREDGRPRNPYVKIYFLPDRR